MTSKKRNKNFTVHGKRDDMKASRPKQTWNVDTHTWEKVT